MNKRTVSIIVRHRPRGGGVGVGEFPSPGLDLEPTGGRDPRVPDPCQRDTSNEKQITMETTLSIQVLTICTITFNNVGNKPINECGRHCFS